jgi:hypothetical protein
MTVIKFEKEIADGEVIYVLDELSVNILAKDSSIEETGILKPWLQWHADFVSHRYKIFRLAWRFVARGRKLWFVLLRHRNQWVRVHIECPRCKVCKTHLTTANPDVHGLYTGVHVFENSSNEIPNVGCPKCGGEIERRAIWVELR